MKPHARGYSEPRPSQGPSSHSHICRDQQLLPSLTAGALPARRRHLATLLKEHALVEGGDLQVATWIKDEGFDTTIPSVMQVPGSSRAQAFAS